MQIFELFSYEKVVNLFIKCLVTEVHQLYLSTKKLPKYQNTVLFKYYCFPEFADVYQANTSLGRPGIFFHNKLHISKLLIVLFISMSDKQY